MDAETLAGRLDRVQVVDVRHPEEWEAGRIEGARNIPADDLPDRVEELDRGRPVVTVCRAGARSDEAAELLRTRGFDAESLDGGLLAWKWAGLAVSGTIVEPDTPPEAQSPEMALHDELLAVTSALGERFGDREPTEEELHEFLRQRLIDEGRTPEEADTFLAEMGEG